MIKHLSNDTVGGSLLLGAATLVQTKVPGF